MPDILDKIVTRREVDYLVAGPSFGVGIPKKRLRGRHPFLAEPGVILEIKRASPSRGPIAMDLDPISQARRYVASGARQISILTEPHFFKGSLEDLVAVGASGIDAALLRKDFLLHEDEIDISHRAGADAVLLIARILPQETLVSMCHRCRELGMVPFVEVREEADVVKLERVLAEGTVIAGVNSRDLRTFQTDPLIPALMRERLPCKAVFESGATNPGHAVYARRLGFEGVLIGEAVSRDPGDATRFIRAFADAAPDRSGAFWRGIAARRHLNEVRPLVKICGLTNLQDVKIATEGGSDLLGFVFANSPRAAQEPVVHQCRKYLETLSGRTRPLLVGVVTSFDDPAGKQAVRLAGLGVLDALQLHGSRASAMMQEIGRMAMDIGRYAAIALGSIEDIAEEQSLVNAGEPRVLVDARVGNSTGGTGSGIPEVVLQARRATVPLWLAGGLGVENIRTIITRYHPELVDLSSSLESVAGKKDIRKVEAFFKEINT